MYQNSGSALNEGVEIAGVAGTDLTGISLVFYEGHGGAPYETVPLAGTIDDLDGTGMGVLWIGLPNGIADGVGSPDGVALVRDSPPPAAVEQFVAYGGSSTATSFVATGGRQWD